MITHFEQQADNYNRVEKALLFLEENAHKQPTLAEIAKSVHLSEFHFQRIFSDWVGISPSAQKIYSKVLATC